jgi:hypothetical protein
MKLARYGMAALAALTLAGCVSGGGAYEPVKFRPHGAAPAPVAKDPEGRYRLVFDDSIKEFNREVRGAGLNNEVKFDVATMRLVYQLLRPHFKELTVATAAQSPSRPRFNSKATSASISATSTCR